MSRFNAYEWGGVCLRDAIINLKPKMESEMPPLIVDGGHNAGEEMPTGFLDEPDDMDLCVREPVIYIENLSNSEINVNVDIMPLGQITETYPQYAKFGDWDVRVSTNNFINDVLPYLFYEVDIKLTECLDSTEHFYQYQVSKADFWELIYDIMVEDSRFKNEHFHHFVQYWAPYIDKYKGTINISRFKNHVIEKYFHTTFGADAPIIWRREYFAFWCDEEE